MSVTLTYFAPRVEPGMVLHYGSLSTTKYDDNELFTVITYATWSDYSGGTVERSNRRVLLADEDLAPHLVAIVGSHGTESVGFYGSLADAPEAVREMIESLDEDPILDDDDVSSLETELEIEAWSDGGSDDFRRALARALDAIDDGHEHHVEDPIVDDRELLALWRDGCDAFNLEGGSGCVIETGCSVHFYTDEREKRAGRLDTSRDVRDQDAYNDRLTALARRTGGDRDAVLVTNDALLEKRPADEIARLIRIARGEPEPTPTTKRDASGRFAPQKAATL